MIVPASPAPAISTRLIPVDCDVRRLTCDSPISRTDSRIPPQMHIVNTQSAATTERENS